MSGWELAGWLLPLGYLIPLTIADIRRRRLPLWLLAAGLGAGLLLRAGMILMGQEELSRDAAEYLPGLIPGALLWLLSRVSKGAIGSGDGACLITLAVWVPLWDLLGILLIALLLAGIGGSIWVIVRKKNFRSELPFLPFLLAAYGVETAAALWG